MGELSSGPGGEYCRVCRAKAIEDYEEAQLKEEQGLNNGVSAAKKAKRSNGVESTSLSFARDRVERVQGGELDVVAVPFVFRLLVAELAAMGIQVSVGVE